MTAAIAEALDRLHQAEMSGDERELRLARLAHKKAVAESLSLIERTGTTIPPRPFRDLLPTTWP